MNQHSESRKVPGNGAEFVQVLQSNEGEVRVKNPPSEIRAGWRRAISALMTGTDLPEGFCVRHTGRNHGDLVVRLVRVEDAPPTPPKLPSLLIPDNLRGCHQIVQATRNAASNGTDGWIDTRRTPNVVHLRVQQTNFNRALLLVQALINEAGRRGHDVGTRKGYRCEGGLHIFVSDIGFEITVKEETRRAQHVLTVSERHDKERGRYIYAPRWDFVPTSRLQIRDDHDSYSSSALATDRQRWKIEDRLQYVFVKIEEKSVEASLRRARLEERRMKAEMAWRTAIDEAIFQHEFNWRAKWLSVQLNARREAADALRFVAEARQLAALSEQDAGWIDWVERYAKQIDPLKKSLTPPPVPEPSPKDLEPYLKGYSPHGPPLQY